MKTSILATAALLTTLTTASPTWNKWGNGKGDWSKEGGAMPSVFEFTSTYSVVATPDQVIGSNNVSAPGQPGAVGYYHFGINSELDTICYNITLHGVTGAYQSPAKTATHIHQAARGVAGPPRLAFPNPIGDDTVRRSVGCLTGPFTTGINNAATGKDTGTGFKVEMIEQNPAAFFCDVHTTAFVPGAVRGQLA